MYYIYDKTSVQSILENLYVKKYIRQSRKIYEFNIENNTLMLKVYDDDYPSQLIETHIIEKNVKGEFGICEDEHKGIHIVVANKKYDLIYIKFDGKELKRETVYHFTNNNVIPATPIIQVQNNLVVIVSEFLTVGVNKEWSLRVYVKKNNIWESIQIDNGEGLCYVQPDIKLDEKNNLHVVYREAKERSYLKYIAFDLLKPRREKAKIILDSEINKYAPSIFKKDNKELFISWVEINDTEANLCCANISAGFQDVFKVEISQNMSDVRIYFSGRHIYCIFQNEAGFYYDMCCRKKLVKQWNPQIIPKKGGAAMNSDFRLFLDIKRELENQIAELKTNGDNDQYEKTINDLKRQNISLSEQIAEKQKELDLVQNEIALLRSEKNPSLWNRIVNFFN